MKFFKRKSNNKAHAEAKNKKDVSDKEFDNNLFFYTILKKLVQLRIKENQLISLQSLIIKTANNADDEESIIDSLCSSSIVVKQNNPQRDTYIDLIELIRGNHLTEWIKMVDLGADLIIYKDLILQESKSYTLTREQKIEKETPDHLSIKYDATHLSLPYGQRVIGSLLVSAITNSDSESPLLLRESSNKLKNIYDRINRLKMEYDINCNNMLALIVNESINQSIVSLAGGSYENRVEYMMQPLVSDWKKHSHDKNIKAMEYDFTFEYNGKKVGISAKRTLRERYKQNHENVSELSVDYVMVFTLGTDLNKDKLDSLLQKDKTYIVVADEVYRTHDYFKNNKRVVSSSELTKDRFDKLFI